MKPYLKKLFCFFLFLAGLLPARAQEACLLLPASLEQRAGQAALIVEAKVIGQQARWDREHRNIYTANLVEVYKVFKGSAPVGGQLEIITEGGSLDNEIHVLSGTLSLQADQQGIFFLEPSAFPVLPHFGLASPLYSVYTSSQGFIRYELPFEEAREPFRTYQSIERELYPVLKALPGLKQQEVKPNRALQQARPRSSGVSHPALRTQATPAISGFTPQVITAGTGAVLTITGSNFGATQGNGFVEFRNANDGGGSFIRPEPAHYVAWTDTRIEVRVPTAIQSIGVAGTGPVQVTNHEGLSHTSSAVLTVEFAVSNVLRNKIPYQPYHVNKNGQGGYTLSFAADVPAAARQAFTRALQNWTCHTAINWVVGSDAPASTALADDDINIIRFAAPGNIPANILGRTTSRYVGCEINGGFRFFVDELDFEFNNSIPWQYGPALPTAAQFDFESVALHEQGHAHQLSHLILPRAVMHYSIARGQVSRQLNGRSEIDGANFVLRNSFRSNICGPPRMAPLVLESCRPVAPLLSFAAEVQPDGSNRLTWSSQQEGPLAGYEVQRSSNGYNWRPLGQVNAGGSTYSFHDPRPFQGITYYRLRLVAATNGSPVYSPIRQAGSESALAFIQLYPNPVQDQLAFEYHAPAAGQLVLRILDTTGREHGRVVRRIAAGNNPFVFDTSRLGRGLYLLQAAVGGEVLHTKFLKL